MKNNMLLIVMCISFLFLSWCGELSQSPEDPQQHVDFCIGVECRTQPTTAEEFMPIFADQVKHYNEIASRIRPNNAVQGFDAIVVNMDRTKARKVDMHGNLTNIPVEEADQYAETIGYDTEFYFPPATDSRKFVVLTLNDENLKNPESFKKYAHIGTYDLFITYVHELFHKYEQPKRPKPENIANREREEFSEKYEARATRGVIIQQLLNAFIYPDQTEEYIKKAVASYRNYQTTFPTDAENSHYRDKNEGTAYYVELLSSLEVWYPDLPLDNIDNLYRAYGKIASTMSTQRWVGAASEGYIVGGLAGILLDYLHIEWKSELMNDLVKTPLDILAEHFDSQISSSDVVSPSEEMLQDYQNVTSKIQNPADMEKAAQNIYLIFNDIRSKDPAAYKVALEEMQKENGDSEVMKRVLELLGEGN